MLIMYRGIFAASNVGDFNFKHLVTADFWDIAQKMYETGNVGNAWGYPVILCAVAGGRFP